MTIVEILFWSLASLILYVYVGYGWLLMLACLFRKKPALDVGHDFEHTVTLVVAAFDEAPWLRRKIENSLRLDYPRENLRILLAVDGEMDGDSRKAAEESGRIVLLPQAERLGKASAINRAMRAVDTEVTVFSDANSMLNRESIRELVRFFADPRVGCVSGEKRVCLGKVNEASSAGEGIYWRYESRIKEAEARLSSCVGAIGELYAIRTALFSKLPDDAILDDFTISMEIVRSGHRIAYAPAARATETASVGLGAEFERKIRIGAGNLQCLLRMPDLLNPFRHGVFAFQYLSHKVLRSFAVPPILLALFFLNWMLLSQGGAIYAVFLLMQILFYSAALAGFWMREKAASFGILFVPLYVVLMNAAAVFGVIRCVRGRQSSSWKKVPRKPCAFACSEGERH